MRTKSLLKCLMMGVMALGVFAPAMAQDMMSAPAVTVQNQLSLNGQVVIESVMSDGPGFVVIHADNGGSPGAVAGFRWVNDGATYNLQISVDAAVVTPTLYAMLHVDDSEIGVYEFGTVDGADAPTMGDGGMVSPPFTVEMVRVHDQLATDSVVAAGVVTQQDGWLVIHADGGGRPGPVLGQTQVAAGANADVVVALTGEVTDVVFPMLHVDTGVAGTYEFGTVEGADGPVVVDGVVATFPVIIGYPSMRVLSQIPSNNTIVAESVVSEGDGWLVIHADNGGAPGPVLGQTQVTAGTNLNVAVELSETPTSVVFPMLHVDTGVVGTYEFGTVEGADGPVFVNEAVLTYPINAAPYIAYAGTLDGNLLTVDAAGIDAQGWLVIHADNDGAPGAVLGQVPLSRGITTNVQVNIEGAPASVFPMLHYDTAELGVYEFGSVEGADGPVTVDGAVVTGPLAPVAP